MGLGNGKPQFSVETRVDGETIKIQQVHDPFIHNTTRVGISRWDLFKGMFKKQYEICVQVSVDGSQGAISAVMMLDSEALEKETMAILEARRLSRESSVENHAYIAGQDLQGV